LSGRNGRLDAGSAAWPTPWPPKRRHKRCVPPTIRRGWQGQRLRILPPAPWTRHRSTKHRQALFGWPRRTRPSTLSEPCRYVRSARWNTSQAKTSTASDTRIRVIMGSAASVVRRHREVVRLLRSCSFPKEETVPATVTDFEAGVVRSLGCRARVDSSPY
jgi:hypothetical protein